MDIDRDLTRSPLTFGFGPHVCLGVHLARREAQQALSEILRRWPSLEVDEAGLRRSRSTHMIGWERLPVTVAAPAPI